MEGRWWLGGRQLAGWPGSEGGYCTYCKSVWVRSMVRLLLRDEGKAGQARPGQGRSAYICTEHGERHAVECEWYSKWRRVVVREAG